MFEREMTLKTTTIAGMLGLLFGLLTNATYAPMTSTETTEFWDAAYRDGWLAAAAIGAIPIYEMIAYFLRTGVFSGAVIHNASSPLLRLAYGLCLQKLLVTIFAHQMLSIPINLRYAITGISFILCIIAGANIAMFEVRLWGRRTRLNETETAPAPVVVSGDYIPGPITR